MVGIPRIGQLHLGSPRRESAAASSSPTCPCGGQASQRAFLNQAPLKLGQSRKEVEHEFAGRRRGIESSITQRAKPHLPLPSSLDQRHEMGQRAPPTIVG